MRASSRRAPYPHTQRSWLLPRPDPSTEPRHRHASDSRPLPPPVYPADRRSDVISAIPRSAPDSLPRPSILALDIDGTILDGAGQLREPVRRAIRKVADSGVHVVLATGRSPWFGVAHLAAELGLTGPQITMQGAVVVEPVSMRVERARFLPDDVYEDALRFADGLGVDPVVGTVDGHRAAHLPTDLDFVAIHAGASTFRHTPDLAGLVSERPVRVFMSTDPDRHLAVRAAALRHFEGRASIVWSDTSGIEVLAAGTNKGEAIRWLARTRGIDLAAVAAAGDAPNDTEMLRVAGRSAAIGPAPAEVRAVAGICVPSSNEDGLLQALASFFPDLASSLARPAA
jgi:5-amino-6-(5-phospho-D-ribitylamino)uracil phosphatase